MKKLSKKEWVAVAIAGVFVAYTMFGMRLINLFRNNNQNPMNETASTSTTNNDTAIATNSNVDSKNSNPNQLITNDISVGNGPEVKNGQLLSVNYILALQDGKVVQNSKDFGKPFQFVLGAGQVIKGWEQGFAGMKVGGTRTIVIPPELGYGAEQAGPIPPNSTLIFTIELLDAQDVNSQ